MRWFKVLRSTGYFLEKQANNQWMSHKRKVKDKLTSSVISCTLGPKWRKLKAWRRWWKAKSIRKQGSIVPVKWNCVNSISDTWRVAISYGLLFVLVIILTTVARLCCLLRESTSEEHVEKLFSCELRFKSSSVRIFVLPEPALVECVSSAHSWMSFVLAVKIIRLPFFRVCEDSDCISDRFKGFNRSWRLVLVRMHLKGELLVSLLNLRVCWFFGHTEHFIIILASVK